MNTTQQNAVDLTKSPWVMDPVTYELALQVLNDAIKYYTLVQAESEKAKTAIIELERQYRHALENYQPLQRKPRP